MGLEVSFRGVKVPSGDQPRQYQWPSRKLWKLHAQRSVQNSLKNVITFSTHVAEFKNLYICDLFTEFGINFMLYFAHLFLKIKFFSAEILTNLPHFQSYVILCKFSFCMVCLEMSSLTLKIHKTAFICFLRNWSNTRFDCKICALPHHLYPQIGHVHCNSDTTALTWGIKYHIPLVAHFSIFVVVLTRLFAIKPDLWSASSRPQFEPYLYISLTDSRSPRIKLKEFMRCHEHTIFFCRTDIIFPSRGIKTCESTS